MRTTRVLSFLLVIALMASLFAGCAKNSNAPTTIDANTTANAVAPTEADTQNNTTPPVDADTNASDNAESDDYEEGTSAADDIVKTAAADKVILVVSFGTSFNQSRSLTIGGIEAAVKNAYPDYQVRRAFTSQIIIDVLAEREGLKIDNVTEAMNRLVLDKVKEVIVQPTTVMSGFEYHDMLDEVMPFAGEFESLKIGKNLLADDGDYSEVAELIVKETSRFRADNTAIVFMGHGTEHEAGSTYTKLQNVLTAKGYDDYVIGTVEHGVEIDEVCEKLADMGVKRVVLRPLMVVAGDHANNDMAGDEEDSWKTILSEDGYAVETVLEGLGQIKGIQDIYIKHIKDAMSSPSISIALAAPAAGVTADRIKNGAYAIEVDSSTSMFKIVDCQLTVEDDRMWAVMTLSGQGFSKVYMGTGEEALRDDARNFIDFVEKDERHAFTVPVEALDRELECSGMSARKETWYDHIVVFESESIPADAFIPCQISVEMAGGTGKASVASPAKLTYQDGKNIAEIIWSSPNYTYMIVDGKKYLTVNKDGNSTFEIPVIIDADMKVIACTVAMSEPKEIAYTLHFDSKTIQ